MSIDEIAVDAPYDALRAAGTLTRLVRVLDQATRDLDQPDHLGISELSILGQVDRGNDLPSGIARTLRLDPARVTRLSDRLVTLNLLRREQDTEDRRRCHLVLTPEGDGRLETGRRALVDVVERVLDRLSPNEREGLLSGLEAARSVLDSNM